MRSSEDDADGDGNETTNISLRRSGNALPDAMGQESNYFHCCNSDPNAMENPNSNVEFSP